MNCTNTHVLSMSSPISLHADQGEVSGVANYCPKSPSNRASHGLLPKGGRIAAVCLLGSRDDLSSGFRDCEASSDQQLDHPPSRVTTVIIL